MLKLAVVALLAAYVSAETYEERGQAYIGDQGTWTGIIHDQFRGWSMDKIRSMLGAKLDIESRNPPMKPQYLFDAENNEGINYNGNWDITMKPAWANCKATFQHIKDQADCGSCWAVAASEVAEDRTCLANANQVKPGQLVEFSAEDIMSCCTWCGNGCEGGYPIDAMRFWAWNGVCTGGPYGSGCGCQPYLIPPCGVNGCSGPIAQTPACSASCRSGYGKNVKQDSHYASDHYQIPQNVQGIQREIYNYGTIECAFTVRSSFLYYHSGVYSACTGPVDGGHAITFVGWGTEGGIPYWLVKNSWNKSWGLNGYIKFKRGVNLCGIEEQCVAGKAKTGDNGFTLTC